MCVARINRNLPDMNRRYAPYAAPGLAPVLFALLGLSLMTPCTAATDGAGSGPGAKSPSARIAKPTGTIRFNEKTLDVDYPAQHAVLSGNVVVSQGDVRVTADRAEGNGLDPKNSHWTLFGNSRWIFTGDVHISSPLQGNLESDNATIEFRDDHMQDAVVTGKPARFEQTSSTTGVLARGYADSIVYTVAADTIRLTDNVCLHYGDNEVTGPVFVYDMRSHQLHGPNPPNNGQRVHVTIEPKPGAAKQSASAPSAATLCAPEPGSGSSAPKPGTPP